LYSLMLVMLLAVWRLRGSGYRTLYVRDVVCAAWLCLLRPLHGGQVIYEVHDLEEAHPTRAARWPARFWKRFLPWLDRVALTKSCKLVSLTSDFRAWAVGMRLRSPADIFVVPDAFDPVIYHPLDRAAARRQLSIPQDTFV